MSLQRPGWGRGRTSPFSIEANAVRRNKWIKNLFGKECGPTAATEMLDKQEIKEKDQSFSRRKSVGGLFLDFCCKEHCKQYPWHGEQMQAGLILGLKHQRTSPFWDTAADSACVLQQRWQGWPSYRKDHVRTLGEEQLPISLYQDSTRISSETTVGLFFSSGPAPISRTHCYAKKKYGPSYTWSWNLPGPCQMGKSFVFASLLPHCGGQTWGISVA